ncbi:hypothetical protein CP061683_1449B, partial [Chlamydia psittaci 06-1683]
PIRRIFCFTGKLASTRTPPISQDSIPRTGAFKNRVSLSLGEVTISLFTPIKRTFTSIRLSMLKGRHSNHKSVGFPSGLKVNIPPSGEGTTCK